MSGPKPGSPYKLTEALIEEARKLLPGVLYLETLADLLGVRAKTVWDWCRRGKAEQERMAQKGATSPSKSGAIYWKFWNMYRRQLAVSEMRAVHAVRAAADDGAWQAAMTLLERRWPHRYGRKDRSLAEKERQAPVPKAYIVTDEWSPDDA